MSHSKNACGGRPTKLTPELIVRICNYIRAGNHLNVVCVANGITFQTYRNWIKRGERARSGIFFELFESVRQAEAECESSLVAGWMSQAPKDWRAAAAFLERRFPERWSPVMLRPMGSQTSELGLATDCSEVDDFTGVPTENLILMLEEQLAVISPEKGKHGGVSKSV